ncbi:MAG: hypothetical protein KatS3mg069_2806 [Meiothermus sp.]|nr:MAG: hypothetical protein KatS3mg069_2806 [Meiothermus sp.]
MSSPEIPKLCVLGFGRLECLLGWIGTKNSENLDILKLCEAFYFWP